MARFCERDSALEKVAETKTDLISNYHSLMEVKGFCFLVEHVCFRQNATSRCL
jgi:hypothetical protein